MDVTEGTAKRGKKAKPADQAEQDFSNSLQRATQVWGMATVTATATATTTAKAIGHSDSTFIRSLEASGKHLRVRFTGIRSGIRSRQARSIHRYTLQAGAPGASKGISQRCDRDGST